MAFKIEINDKNINIIANYLLEDRTGGNLEDRVSYIKRDWYREAEEMLANYNFVVDILRQSYTLVWVSASIGHVKTLARRIPKHGRLLRK